MPFAVFRRHQRKLLAVFAILAMFGFVVADSLPRLLNSGYSGGGDPVVVELQGRKVKRSDLNEVAASRSNANYFIAVLSSLSSPRPIQDRFGDLRDRSLVDALILKQEADRLGIPGGADVGRNWLRQAVGAGMTAELFELVLSRFSSRNVTGEQVLADIGEQVRIQSVLGLIGQPAVTPLDIFNAYRDQNERVGARAVPFPVEDFLGKVPEPTEAQIAAFFGKYQDVLPEPDSPTPGFKIPRQIQVELLSLDGDRLRDEIKVKLTEPELRSYYENRKNEFKKPSEFPDEIFVGQPELTPPQVQPFEELRPFLSTSLAEERAQSEIVNKFGRIKDEVLLPFTDQYLEVVDEITDAEKDGKKLDKPLPEPSSLKDLATKEGLEHEVTPLLSRDRADKYGLISGAEVGLTKSSGGRRFVEELFDAKSALYEPIELTDFTGRRYLIRKLKDNPPKVPDLDDVRPEVVRAWKIEQARPLAKKAAEELAAKVNAKGGKLEGTTIEARAVLTIDPTTKLQPGLPLPGRFFETGPATPTPIPQIPSAGEALREALFGLKEGEAAVAPNQPETTYYVLSLDRRIPATFEVLYAPNGDYIRYRSEVLEDAVRKHYESWMTELRQKAGLPKDWVPPDEARNADQGGASA